MGVHTGIIWAASGRQLSFVMGSAAEFAVEEHHAIVVAISKGAASGADDAMRTHLRQILFDLPTKAELRPNYFENFDFQFNANVNCN